jgi:hypothetical protein
MGQEAAAYLRAKRKRLTDSSYRGYEGCLDKLAWGTGFQVGRGYRPSQAA